jgi:hypothetical protein
MCLSTSQKNAEIMRPAACRRHRDQSQTESGRAGAGRARPPRGFNLRFNIHTTHMSHNHRAYHLTQIYALACATLAPCPCRRAPRSRHTRCHGEYGATVLQPTPHPQPPPPPAPKRHIYVLSQCALRARRAPYSIDPLSSHPPAHPPPLMEPRPRQPQPPRRRALAAPHSAAGLRRHACAV